MALSLRRYRRHTSAPLTIEARSELLTKALRVARDPKLDTEMTGPDRPQVLELVKAVQTAASWTRSGGPAGNLGNARPVSAQTLAERAHRHLGPSASVTPAEIEVALRRQGMDWVEPFAPGAPLVPYYGYGRRPRNYDYTVGRNITTDTRPDRIPFATLKRLFEGYDVAAICTRHAINDLRSMRLRFEPMDGYEDNPVKEIAAAKAFLRKPDGIQSLRNWLAEHAMNVWRYDAGAFYRQRDRAGRLVSLQVIDATTVAPMLDYFGATPQGDAPAFQQFIQGIPWDWLTTRDLVYVPMWPLPESPYGVAPLETVLINANTDVRLQTYFLQFFTTGQVPEAFAVAPEGQSDPDSLAEWQETWNDWTFGDQSERWGLRWLPAGTDLKFYKPQQFDPHIAEYVMRRTVAAFQMTPSDLGFTDGVNKASGDTQMDVQFRINTLPHCAYYEDMLDDVLQCDLDLPVQVRFDTGREREDRLMEAQAHQIYVSIGAESPDEVREKVLGHPTNPAEKVPRFFDSVRLGPIPVSYLLSVAGQIDPLTGAPVPGSVVPREYVPPGMTALVGAAAQSDPDDPHAFVRSRALPGEGKSRLAAARKALEAGDDPWPIDEASHPREPAGYGQSPADESAEQEAAEQADLRRWRSQSRSRVDKGRSPRPFVDSQITSARYDQVWAALRHASSREQVDAAFTKARRVATWADFHHNTDRLVEHYTPLLQQAFARELGERAVAEALAAHVEKGYATDALQAALTVLRSAARHLTELRAVFASIYADGWTQGAAEAAQASGGQMPAWSATLDRSAEQFIEDWRPELAPMIAAAASGGLRALLADAEVWMAEITTTQIDRIGDAIASGIREGWDPARTQEAVGAIVGDPARARLIAETELTRAFGAGAMDTYRANGVQELAWLAEPTACVLCKQNEAASPIPIGARWPNGPIPVHPHERCAVAPYYAFLPTRGAPK